MKRIILSLALLLLPVAALAEMPVMLCVNNFSANGGQSCVPVNTGYNNLFNNIASAKTTLVKTGAGSLHSIVVNNKGSTVTVTIYDSLTAAGTKIATMLLTSESTITFDVAFYTGLTVVTSGTTDITVSYR